MYSSTLITRSQDVIVPHTKFAIIGFSFSSGSSFYSSLLAFDVDDVLLVVLLFVGVEVLLVLLLLLSK